MFFFVVLCLSESIIPVYYNNVLNLNFWNIEIIEYGNIEPQINDLSITQLINEFLVGQV